MSSCQLFPRRLLSLGSLEAKGRQVSAADAGGIVSEVRLEGAISS